MNMISIEANPNLKWSVSARQVAIWCLSGLFIGLLQTNAIAQLPVDVDVVQTDCDSVQTVISQPTCQGVNDGSINILPAGQVDFIDVAWPEVPSTDGTMATDLDAGLYAAIISTDNCVDTLTFDLAYQSPILANDLDTVACTEVLRLNLLQQVSGGGTDSYTLDVNAVDNPNLVCEDCPPLIDIETSQLLRVKIKSEAGCTTTRLVNVDLYEPLETSAALMAEDCNDNGSIALSTMGGTGNYLYAMADTDQYQFSGLFTDLPGDATYTFNIVDLVGCRTTASFFIDGPEEEPDFGVRVTASCPDNHSGIVIVEAGKLINDGYSYSLDSISWQTSPLFTDVPPGEYIVYVRNPTDCTVAEIPITVPESIPPVVQLQIQEPTCASDTNATLSIQVVNNHPDYPYFFSLDDEDYSAATFFTDLSGGWYTLFIQDTVPCAYELPFEIEAPAPLQADLTVVPETCTNTNGLIACVPYGGTGPYTYHWNQGDSTAVIQDLSSGNFRVSVVDQQGCTHQAEAVVENLDGPLVLAEEKDIDCYGQLNGSIDLTVIGGTAPLFYVWSNGVYTEDQDSLAAGSYIVTVIDDNQCSSTKAYQLFEPAPLELSTETGTYEQSWFINLEVTGGQAPYQYAWSNGATSEDLFDLIPGQYTVIVTDQQGCETTTLVDIVTATHTPDADVSFRIFPVPIRDQVTISWEKPGATAVNFTLFSASGQPLLQQRLTQTQTTLSVDHLPAGIYFVRLQLADKEWYEKVVVL